MTTTAAAAPRRRVVAYTLCSLDGAVDAPNRYFPDIVAREGANPPIFDDAMIAKEAALIATQDAVLLGRNMYDEWAGYWPTSDEQPFADFINGVRKYVVTSTDLTTQWGEAEAVHAPLRDVVADLTSRPGGDIGVHGSIQLVQSLIADDLVDQMQLAVAPVIDPVGRRLFETMPALRFLTLTSATATPSGAMWLVYERSS